MHMEMSKQHIAKLKKKLPEKEGRDPAKSKIEKVVLAMAGYKYKSCKRCGGKGARVGEKLCSVCEGTGQVPTTEVVNLTWFDVNIDRCYMSKGGRLVLVLEDDKAAGYESIPIRRIVNR